MSVEFDRMHLMRPTQVSDSEPELVAAPLGVLSKLLGLFCTIAAAWRFAQAIRRKNGFCDEGGAARIAVQESLHP